MLLQKALQSGKLFKLPTQADYLTVLNGHIVNSRTSAIVTLTAAELLSDQWDTKSLRSNESIVVEVDKTTPVIQMVGGLFKINYTGKDPATYQISIKEV